MKYTIEGFDQEYAMTLVGEDAFGRKLRLDCTDLVILRWFTDFYPKASKVTVNDREFISITYGFILEQLPFLNMNKRSLADRMKKMADLEVLDFMLQKTNGTYALYTFGGKYDGLVVKKAARTRSRREPKPKNPPYQIRQPECPQTTDPGVPKPTDKHSSIHYSSILYSSPPYIPPQENRPTPPPTAGVGMSGFDEFWERYPRKINRAMAEQAWRRVSTDPAFDIREVIAAVDNAILHDSRFREDRYTPNAAKWLMDGDWKREWKVVETPMSGSFETDSFFEAALNRTYGGKKHGH